MRRSRGYGRGGFVAVIVLASGCAEELGPESMPTTRVTGVVREGTSPVGGGWIEFFPVDGTVGNLRTAPIRTDGSFTADRVAVGENRICLAQTPVDPRLGRMFTVFSSTIRRQIPAGPSTTLEIDLYEEAIRQQKVRAPAD